MKVLDPVLDADAIEEKAKSGEKSKAQNVQLDFMTWQMAWDRYALAAAMTKMISFAIAGRYKQASTVHVMMLCQHRRVVCAGCS